MQLEFADRARFDIEDIVLDLGNSSKSRAERLLGQIEAELVLIADRPLLYQLRPEIGNGARQATVKPYSLLFRVIGDVIRIERVVHGRRDLTALLR